MLSGGALKPEAVHQADETRSSSSLKLLLFPGDCCKDFDLVQFRGSRPCRRAWPRNVSAQQASRQGRSRRNPAVLDLPEVLAAKVGSRSRQRKGVNAEKQASSDIAPCKESSRRPCTRAEHPQVRKHRETADKQTPPPFRCFVDTSCVLSAALLQKFPVDQLSLSASFPVLVGFSQVRRDLAALQLASSRSICRSKEPAQRLSTSLRVGITLGWESAESALQTAGAVQCCGAGCSLGAFCEPFGALAIYCVAESAQPHGSLRCVEPLRSSSGHTGGCGLKCDTPQFARAFCLA